MKLKNLIFTNFLAFDKILMFLDLAKILSILSTLLLLLCLKILLLNTFRVDNLNNSVIFNIRVNAIAIAILPKF